MILLLSCPACHKRMKYQARGQILTGKRKSCVYCGKSFSVRKRIVKKPDV